MALARQHRFVVKDNLWDYDCFMNFEDDMIINAGMVDNYLQMSHIYEMRATASEKVRHGQLRESHGALTKDQLKRCYPGLIRVEVLLNETMLARARKTPMQRLGPVPIADHPDIDPLHCCHLSDVCSSDSRPRTPTVDEVYLWETNIFALGVRHINKLGWVVLQRGTNKRGRGNTTVLDFWSGTNHYFGKERPMKMQQRPNTMTFKEWHTEICSGGE
jgi:hypothetical protein